MTLANKEMLEKCAGEAGKAVHKAQVAGRRALETGKQRASDAGQLAEFA
jgi:hypothetical protein